MTMRLGKATYGEPFDTWIAWQEKHGAIFISVVLSAVATIPVFFGAGLQLVPFLVTFPVVTFNQVRAVHLLQAEVQSLRDEVNAQKTPESETRQSEVS